MNIKKSPLLAGLLSLSALVAPAKANAEDIQVHCPMTQKDASLIFDQEEVGSVEINGVKISMRTGWSLIEKEIGENDTVVTHTWRAPYVVQGKNKNGTWNRGFAKARRDVPDVGTIAVNEDNGKMYGFSSNVSTNFYEISFGEITSSEPLTVLGQLSPKRTQLGFYSANDESSNLQDTRVDQAFAWTDPAEGEFFVTYNKEGGKKSTTVWHRNGVVNRRAQYKGIEPVEVYKGDNTIYYSNGTDMAQISKANPEAGETAVESLSGRVGAGVVGDDLYQAKSDGIYLDGAKQQMWESDGEGGNTPWKPTSISHMIGANGELIMAYNANASSVTFKDVTLDNGVKVLGVAGAEKIVKQKDGIYALAKGKLERIHE